jgi:excisionase family DNA binding protein
LTIAEASEALGISDDSFRRHVAPELRLVRLGRLTLVSVRELERWLEEHGARVLPS